LLYYTSSIVFTGSTSVEAYFPAGKWYDFYTNEAVTTSGETTLTLYTPFDHIQVSYTLMALNKGPRVLLLLPLDVTIYYLIHLFWLYVKTGDLRFQAQG